MLISAYISAIPPGGDASCADMQNISGWLLDMTVNNTISPKVGAAARPSQPAAPGAAAWPLPTHPPI
jgi:hypothetical protein